MRRISILILIAAAAMPAPAIAQRLPFEKTFDVAAPIVLDVSNDRGKIEVVAGDAGRVVVAGTVTVRVGFNVPDNAVEIAQRLAASPPLTRDGDTFRLRDPSDPADRRAVTIGWQVRVPAHSTLRTDSDSGATTVSGLTADVTVTTKSGAIRIVEAGSSVRIRTESGAVETSLTGTGDVDVQTGSSGVDLSLPADAAFSLDASSNSGDVSVEGASVDGTVVKHRVAGSVGRGGPLVHLGSQSGAIRVRVGAH